MNKGSFLNSRKFRHGSTAVILTAFVIAVIVIVNILNFVVYGCVGLGCGNLGSCEGRSCGLLETCRGSCFCCNGICLSVVIVIKKHFYILSAAAYARLTENSFKFIL